MIRTILILAMFCGVAQAQQQPTFRPLRVGDSIPYYTANAPVDAYNFGSWINGLRASRGLAPLAYDPQLAADAAANSSRGFGHAFLGRARRQNVGMGAFASVCSMWVASPAHASALFDPRITRYGIACVNGVWTFGAY